jgi:hypothetical protein
MYFFCVQPSNGQARRVNSASRNTFPYALEQSDFQLLDDPQGSFEAGHSMEFGKHLAPAEVLAVKREHDQPEQSTGSEPERHEQDQAGPPIDDELKEFRDHQANLPTRDPNRASLRAS